MPSAEDHDDDASVSPPSPNASAGRLKRLRIITAAIVLGGATGLGGVLMYMMRQSGPSLPSLTVKRFDEARAEWESNPLSNYDIQIEVKGMQPAVYEVQVRNGAARQALRNGRPLTQRRTWGTWSVDGMFATIASDVEHLRRRERSGDDAEAGSMQLTLGAEFNAQHHYPARYFRLEQVQFGNNRSVTWEVVRFKPVEAKPTLPSAPAEGGGS